MSFNYQLLLLAVLLAGVLAAWIRGRDSQAARVPRGRLRQLGWALALGALAVSVMASASSVLERHGRPWLFLIAVAVALVLALGPALPERIVPLALMVLGLSGFVVARYYWPATPWASDAVSSYGLTLVGNRGVEYDLVLPQAYALLLLGGWLTWRSNDPTLARARMLLLGRVAVLPPRAQLRALLLLPVVMLTAATVTSGLWFGFGAGTGWTVLVLVGTIAVLRRWPDVASRLAAAGMLGLGLAGLLLTVPWPVSDGPIQYGAVLLVTRHTANAGLAQALALLVAGTWLVPQAFPLARRLLGMAPDAELTRRVQRLTESRAVAVDTAATDLRRLERDLHDGAQARLVALGMNLRAVERLIPVSPDAALALVAEARETSARALTELRELVRGVHPPVLADRGLGDAIRALALDTPMKVETDIDLAGRLAAPIETACYFSVAEVLTNAAKHSGARDARIAVSHDDGMLRIAVTDFGVGGADPGRGSGLAGVEKRLAAFDGIVAVSSPVGGPTMVVLEVPCALSSPRISSC